jgi:diguanylate cyclase (GGDEF)-like protein
MDEKGIYKKANREFAQLLELSLQQIEGKHPNEIGIPGFADAARMFLELEVSGSEPATKELVFQGDKGNRIFSMTKQRLLDNEDRTVFVGTLFELTNERRFLETLVDFNQRLETLVSEKTQELVRANEELMRSNRELGQLALIDPLTNLSNRRGFDMVFSSVIEDFLQYGIPCALIMMDIDLFKRINDELGHEAGDSVLRQIGVLLRNRLRANDYACRWGGEEFIVLCPQTKLKDAIALAESIRGQLEASAILLDRRVTASFGVASSDMETLSLVEVQDCSEKIEAGPAIRGALLIEQADAHMYEAKRAGRNCVRY